jgi:cysteine desulfurase / selenocysteine lyase
MAIKGVIEDGDHVITTDLEHNSVSRPLVSLATAGRISLTRVPADGGGTVDPDAIAAAFTPKTRMVVMTHGSNVLGTVQPIADVGRLCREREILFLVDAAQTVGVVPIDIQAMQIDLLAFPGHKSLLGPTGTGALYVGQRAKIRPWREGGTGGDSSTPVQPSDYPYYLEGGTPNVLGVVGMVAGLDYVEEETPDEIREHEVMLCDRLRDKLEEAGGFHFYGHSDRTRRVGTISFRHESIPAPELGGVLDQAFSIAIRPGLHCSPYIHKSLGSYPEGLLRVSPGAFTTVDEIDQLVEALKEITGGL